MGKYQLTAPHGKLIGASLDALCFCMLIMCFLVKTLRLGTIGALCLIDQMD
ncbi:hypothetical protein O999_13125 [Pseudomonas putida LF54]|nr:hypothetical protein O999_13125 [Pseudomonas putida LF54]